MFEFHKDKDRYFRYQYLTSRDYIIPFIKDFIDLDQICNVLEIGCAEAGVLKAFTENNHRCLGIEMNAGRVELAKKFLHQEYQDERVKFLVKDIYDLEIENDIGHTFDLIILKDVIEHIPNQQLFLKRLKELMSPGAKIFFAFPPWQMPFGGHQQLFENKFLTLLPYFHLLPKRIYTFILKAFGESEDKIQALLEIKDTGISIERFEHILFAEKYSILKRNLFLVNPIYQYKFGLKTRNQFKLISSIPVLRNFLTTCAYYLVEQDKTDSISSG